MKVIRPDSPDQCTKSSVAVFLAGTIDNGAVEPWAHLVAEACADIEGSAHGDIIFFDPRRENWNPNLENRAHCKEFRDQVEWELAHIQGCDIPFFNFVGGSVSPITLQELGYVIAGRVAANGDHFMSSELPVVVCPDDFWRKGNVEIMCEMHNIPVHNTLEEGIEALRAAIDRVMWGYQ